ncbi:MAG: peptidoglycan-binding domain-containing protein [Bacteroidota bacterium]
MKSTFTTLLVISLFQTAVFAQLDDDVRYSDLPPNAEYGKCYAKCKAPDIFETFTRKVLVEAAYTKRKAIPAVYETQERQVMVTEGGVNYKTIPATYKTITDKEIIEPEQKIVNIIPAKYETKTRKVLVKEESGEWVKKKKDPNCFSSNPEDCLIACYEKIPAVYKTETYEVMVSPEKTEERIIPAKYKTIKRQVVDTPEKIIEIPYDPVYKTVEEKVLVTPEKIIEEPVPAVYKNVTEKRLAKKGDYTVWTEILCANKTSASTIRKLQRALRAEGYSVGTVDGRMGTRTQTALKQFQTDNGLPVGNLNMETLKSLGIPY